MKMITVDLLVLKLINYWNLLCRLPYGWNWWWCGRFAEKATWSLKNVFHKYVVATPPKTTTPVKAIAPAFIFAIGSYEW